ncbi:MAG: hypothetical protein E6I62_03630 [Chloroflexi bacterium]|nr:MAG: hypothetical protein E6I62_03630 [Chloroflexota bacterium]
MVNDGRHDPEAVRRLLARTLASVRGGDAEAVYMARDFGLTRFANSQIHQNVVEHDATLRVRLTDDGRTGVASTNRLDDEGLRDVLGRAQAIRDRAARNPDGAPMPEGIATSHASFGSAEATTAADPSTRAAAARAVIAASDGADLMASGAFSTETQTMGVANTRGVERSETSTLAKLVTVVMDDGGGSGYSQACSIDVTDIDGSLVGAEAVDKALRSAGASDLEPGEYPVVRSHRRSRHDRFRRGPQAPGRPRVPRRRPGPGARHADRTARRHRVDRSWSPGAQQLGTDGLEPVHGAGSQLLG